MSIFSQIGEWTKKNQGDIVLIIGFVFVALISFGLGYLSAPQMTKSPLIIEGPTAAISEQATSEQDASNAQDGQSSSAAVGQGNEKGIIVASKNGTKYYWPWSPWAKRIKPENLVWFKSESEAQKAGYSKSSDFDNIAPAGYTK